MQIVLKKAHNHQEIVTAGTQKITEFANRGFRALGIAKGPATGPTTDVKWEMMGLLPLYDPPRHDTKDTIDRCIDKVGHLPPAIQAPLTSVWTLLAAAWRAPAAALRLWSGTARSNCCTWPACEHCSSHSAQSCMGTIYLHVPCCLARSSPVLLLACLSDLPCKTRAFSQLGVATIYPHLPC